MSTKIFDTKKSGHQKKRSSLKMAIVATLAVAVTAAAGFGGYKLIQSSVASQGNNSSRSSYANNGAPYQAPTNKQEPTYFRSFSEAAKSPTKNIAEKAPKAKSGKHLAKHSKKKHGKHYAKHSKKKHGKHYAKHSKKKHGKHYAKHSKHKKKHAQLASTSR